MAGCEDGNVYLWNVTSGEITEVCRHDDSIVYLSAILYQGKFDQRNFYHLTNIQILGKF